MIKKLLILLLIFGFAGCKSDHDGEQGDKGPQLILPSNTGRAGELLVVLDRSEWNGELGKVIRDCFAAEIPGLPQVEPYFEIIHIEPKAFKSIFKTTRNIILFEKADSVMRYMKSNQWASDQELIYLAGPNYDSHISYLKKNGSKLRKALRDREKYRINKGFSKVINREIKSLLANHELQLTVPSDFFVAYADDDFFWIRKEISSGTQGIMFSILPFTDEAQMLSSNILQLRDSLAAKHVTGGLEGSFMTTEYQYLPYVESFEHEGMYAVAIKGLWKMEGDFMGGPFYTLALLDENKERILFIDAFTYAPKMEKSILMLQLETIVESLKLGA